MDAFLKALEVLGIIAGIILATAMGLILLYCLWQLFGALMSLHWIAGVGVVLLILFCVGGVAAHIRENNRVYPGGGGDPDPF